MRDSSQEQVTDAQTLLGDAYEECLDDQRVESPKEEPCSIDKLFGDDNIPY